MEMRQKAFSVQYVLTVVTVCRRLLLSHFCQYRLGLQLMIMIIVLSFLSIIWLLYKMSESCEKMLQTNMTSADRGFLQWDKTAKKFSYLRSCNQEKAFFLAKSWRHEVNYHNCGYIFCRLTNRLNEYLTNCFSQGCNFHCRNFIFGTIIPLNMSSSCSSHNPDDIW